MNTITPTQEGSLTECEWQIVEMALKDRPRSLNPDGRFARFIQCFFGIRIARKLANEKLEAVRRFCVRAWYWNIIRTKDLWMLTDADYPTGVVFQILAHIADRRAAQVIAAIPAAPNVICEGQKGNKPNGENSTIPAQRIPYNHRTNGRVLARLLFNGRWPLAHSRHA